MSKYVNEGMNEEKSEWIHVPLHEQRTDISFNSKEALAYCRRKSSLMVNLLDSRYSSRLKAQGPVSPKLWKLFGPEKPFLVHLYLKMEKCIHLKLLI